MKSVMPDVPKTMLSKDPTGLSDWHLVLAGVVQCTSSWGLMSQYLVLSVY